MIDNPWFVGVSTAIIIVLSAFFVAVEFSLIAARRHRIEDAAATSGSARAALRSANELTLLLAGSQLGITICALALGSLTKPAVHHWLTPVMSDWGWPLWLADGAGFVLALIIVTFLHLVIGEMAPKSWAIAHPERSAIMLAIPMRGFMWLTRPLLRWMNGAANWCLRKVGVDPTDTLATGQDPSALRHLVEHSANVGALDASFSRSISGAIALETMALGDIVKRAPLTVVRDDATVADVQQMARDTGHLRILVDTAPGGETPTPDLLGMVHVRDTLALAQGTRIADLVRPLQTIEVSTLVYDALAQMRETSSHLVLVTENDVIIGVLTMADLLRQLVPRPATATAG